MLDNIVQSIRYFVQFCVTFNRHNNLVVTSCSSFIKMLNWYIYLLILSIGLFHNFCFFKFDVICLLKDFFFNFI